jgi:hypothetical protein
MSVIAASLPLFATVVIVVGLLGCAAAAVVLIRHRDAFVREGGTLWMFHGEPDAVEDGGEPAPPQPPLTPSV